MRRWAAAFFVIALVAALYGFGGIATNDATLAKVLFIVCLALAAGSMLLRRRVPT